MYGSKDCSKVLRETCNSGPCPRQYRWKWRRKSKKETQPLPPAPPLPPYEEENWEEEMGIVETYGFAPYGLFHGGWCSVIPNWRRHFAETEVLEDLFSPEDVDRVALQGLTLNQPPCPPHPQTATDYSPATHHQAPIKWVCHIICIVKEQFVDAEDYFPAVANCRPLPPSTPSVGETCLWPALHNAHSQEERVQTFLLSLCLWTTKCKVNCISICTSLSSAVWDSAQL
eukprot:XP_013986300.1 PREDICTED: uncharacterized protein LOC106564648 isoform X1 [Salmo salar]